MSHMPPINSQDSPSILPVFPSASGLSRGYSGMHSKKRSKMAAALSFPYCPRMCIGDWPLATKMLSTLQRSASHLRFRPTVDTTCTFQRDRFEAKDCFLNALQTIPKGVSCQGREFKKWSRAQTLQSSQDQQRTSNDCQHQRSQSSTVNMAHVYFSLRQGAYAWASP